MQTPNQDGPDFDEFASRYCAVLDAGLSVSGETHEYFARGRLRWLRTCLDRLGVRPESVLDFGCGIGTTAPLFLELLGAKQVLGVDASCASVREAQRRCRSPHCRFVAAADMPPDVQVDVAYCNGVFHHIAPGDRRTAVTDILRWLKPEGLFAFWENNPYNPGTRYIMRRVAFDRDAIPLTAGHSRRLLRASGFKVLRTDYAFVFPRFLATLRAIEPWLGRFPLGAQYQVLACLDDRPFHHARRLKDKCDGRR